MLVLVLAVASRPAAAPELLYEPLSGGRFVPGHGAPANPDPLRDYVWNLTAMPGPNTSLQLISLLPAAIITVPASAFSGASSLVNSSAGTARAVADGTLRVDFGMELAGWLELRSPDLSRAAVAAGCVTMSVGESTVPKYFAPSRLSPKVHNATSPMFAGWKTEVPTPHVGGVFRLELNAELFEGMRYGFVHVNTSCGAAFTPFTITSLKAIAQVKIANWAAFSPPGRPVLERAWYVGGYTVKLNLFDTTDHRAIGSILDQRGDRTPKGKMIGFAGDANPAQATSMAAFGNFELVKSMQRQLSEFDSVYGTYCMYWVLSLADDFAATSDVAFVKDMLAAGWLKMRRSKHRALSKPLPPGTPPPPKRGTAQYAGWDERFNFAQLTPEGKFYPENGYIMRALYVQASQAFADLAELAGNATLAATYRAEATKITNNLRSGAGGETPGHEWWHAAAHAANAGLINATEAPLVFAARFNESSKVCSFSNFNQYFVLQGIRNLGFPSHALASIELCWGTKLALGATSFWEVSGYGGGWASALSRAAWTANGDTPPGPGHSTGADSKCHPWASGVTAWLSHEAAGLRPHQCHGNTSGPATSNYAPPVCIVVRPLLSTVLATLPTPHGELSISIDASAGTYSLTAPSGVELVGLSLPLADGCTGVESVRLNDIELDPMGVAAVIPAPWHRGNGLFDSYIQFDDVGAMMGVCVDPLCTLQIRVHCKAMKVVEEPLTVVFPRPPDVRTQGHQWQQ